MSCLFLNTPRFQTLQREHYLGLQKSWSKEGKVEREATSKTSISMWIRYYLGLMWELSRTERNEYAMVTTY